MKKFLLSLLAVMLIGGSSFAATWNAADRISTVSKNIVSKNSLPAKLKFQTVEGAVDNSQVATNNIVQISKTDLQYTGTDTEVAAVISYELGQIINGKAGKENLRNAAKAVLASNLSDGNLLTSAANSEFLNNKTSLNDQKEADMTAVDLLVNAGYNPLALVVVITKMPGSNMEIIMGKPANSERAMSAFNYITYNYPDKIKAGYGCQEYKNFLVYANPIVEKRNASSKSLKKFNKEQEKIKAKRLKNLNQYKATGGLSGWDATYSVLNNLSK